jgi:hypothetical protein
MLHAIEEQRLTKRLQHVYEIVVTADVRLAAEVSCASCCAESTKLLAGQEPGCGPGEPALLV